jgi:hypothetical protein
VCPSLLNLCSTKGRAEVCIDGICQGSVAIPVIVIYLHRSFILIQCSRLSLLDRYRLQLYVTQLFHNNVDLMISSSEPGGVNCNTSGIEGICGGVNAVAIDESADGLDYGRDYCAAGQSPRTYFCIISQNLSCYPSMTRRLCTSRTEQPCPFRSALCPRRTCICHKSYLCPELTNIFCILFSISRLQSAPSWTHFRWGLRLPCCGLHFLCRALVEEPSPEG